MSETFVRKDFYVSPPAKNATVGEWNEWMREDDAKARAHKAQCTKSQRHVDLPKNMQERTMRKVGGRWRQTTAIGIVGDERSCTLEPMVEANQEAEVIRARLEKEGGRRRKKGGSSARKNRARRLRRLREAAKE